MRICLHDSLRPYPGTTIARDELPSCVTPSLTYYPLSSQAPQSRPPPKIQPSGLRGQYHEVQRWRVPAGTGISTRYPSITPVGLTLGPDLPWAD